MKEKFDLFTWFKNSEYPEKIKKCFECISIQLKNSDYWNNRFDHFARFAAKLSGRALAFNIAMLVILTWFITGPLFSFSDTWQLIINTATTIVTFLMVFIIQHTQNRDTEALQVKLDELIRSIEGANNALLDLEEMEEQELAVLRKQYTELARLAKEEARLAKEEARLAKEEERLAIEEERLAAEEERKRTK